MECSTKGGVPCQQIVNDVQTIKDLKYYAFSAVLFHFQPWKYFNRKFIYSSQNKYILLSKNLAWHNPGSIGLRNGHTVSSNAGQSARCHTTKRSTSFWTLDTKFHHCRWPTTVPSSSSDTSKLFFIFFTQNFLTDKSFLHLKIWHNFEFIIKLHSHYYGQT